MERVCGGVEGGGAKFVCLLGSGSDHVVDEIRFPTTTPDETLGRIVAFFQQPRDGLRLAAVGVGSFGPIDLDRVSPTYGYVTSTPKPHWHNTNVVGFLRDTLGVPIGWDTDVNGAALGERRWGAGGGADPFKTIRARLAGVLVDLSAHLGPDISGYTRQDLAERVGAYRESVSVALGELQRAGALTLEPQRIWIRAGTLLRRISEQGAMDHRAGPTREGHRAV